MEFDVFGRRIIVERRDDSWVCYERGDDGTRRPAAFMIPPDMPEDELANYLADLFHESARPDRPEVRRVR